MAVVTKGKFTHNSQKVCPPRWCDIICQVCLNIPEENTVSIFLLEWNKLWKGLTLQMMEEEETGHAEQEAS